MVTVAAFCRKDINDTLSTSFQTHVWRLKRKRAAFAGKQRIKRVNGANIVNSEKILYSRREAAHLLSVSTRTLDRLIGYKMLIARRLGRRVMLSHVELMKLSRKDTLVICDAALNGSPQKS